MRLAASSGSPTKRSRRNLKRAVIATEDAGFAEHSGVEWDAIEKAWERNARAEARAERTNERSSAARSERRAGAGAAGADARSRRSSAARPSRSSWPRTCSSAASAACCARPRSSCSPAAGGAARQAAHPRDLPEQRRMGRRRVRRRGRGAALLPRRRRSQLGAMQAARLAVMLPAPKRFEKRPGSAYVVGRAATIAARMGRGRAAVTARLESADDRSLSAEIAATAARLVVEEGMEYGPAKRTRRARRSARPAARPSCPATTRSKTRCAPTSRSSTPTPSRPSWPRCATSPRAGWSGWRRSART